MKPEAWIACEDPGEIFPLFMSSYVVEVEDEKKAAFRAAPFGKLRCIIWGFFHGYGWLKERS